MMPAAVIHALSDEPQRAASDQARAVSTRRNSRVRERRCHEVTP
jgi:hypothetical protein